MTNDRANGSDTPAGAAAFTAAQWSLGEQFRAIEGLDSKAERLFGGTLAMVGLYGAIVTLTVDRGTETAAIAALILGVPVLATFAYGAYSFLRGYRISGWSAGPPGAAMLNVAGRYPDAQTQLWLAEEFTRSFEENLASLEEKARRFRRGLFSLFTELAVALGSVGAVAIVELAARNSA